MDIINDMINESRDMEKSFTDGLSLKELLSIRKDTIESIALEHNVSDANVFYKFIYLAEKKQPFADNIIKEWAERFANGKEFESATQKQKDILIKLNKEYEGIVPDPNKDSEETIIKKLTEEDNGNEDSMEADEEEVANEIEDEVKDTKEEEEVDLEKEYFGNIDDIHYYLVKMASDEDATEDLQIVNAEGEKVYSAIDNDLDPMDLITFVKEALKNIQMVDFSYDLFQKYILPLIEEEVEEEEDIAEEEVEEIDEPNFDEEMEDEPPMESVKVNYKNRCYEVKPVDLTEDAFRFTVGNKQFNLSKAFLNIYNEGTVVGSKEQVEKIALDILKQCDEETLTKLESADYKEVSFA